MPSDTTLWIGEAVPRVIDATVIPVHNESSGIDDFAFGRQIDVAVGYGQPVCANAYTEGRLEEIPRIDVRAGTRGTCAAYLDLKIRLLI